VVIPAHNERDRITACLASVGAAAARVAVPVTVVVVLDACTDGSEHVVAGPVRTLRIAARNVGAARAFGFAHAAGAVDAQTWYATTDADSVVPVTWLSAQMNHHRNGDHAMVGTVDVDWRHHSSTTQRTYERLYKRRYEGPGHGHVHGANLGVRADLYWQVGGFRALGTGEDVDLVERLVRADARIVWDRRNPVITSDRPDSRVSGGFGDYVGDLVGQP
jgi:glycosyltransferase involved in cell wall biosynthesis